jgi:hypothetical protein
MKVINAADIDHILSSGQGSHYVYILRYPDKVEVHAGLGTPFYVGIGQRYRLFEHEKEARTSNSDTAKLRTIREIWANGGEVVRTIDSVHLKEPWLREDELLRSIGLISDQTGPLTNAQKYAPSLMLDGAELRKYALDPSVDSGDAIPAGFKLRHTPLRVGPKTPRGTTSVFSKIYAVVQSNPEVTGSELISLLKGVDFSSNKSAYTQNGVVSAAWLAGYIDGAVFHPRARYLQPSSRVI